MMDNSIKIKIDKTKYLLNRLQEERNRLIKLEKDLNYAQKVYHWDNENKIKVAIIRWMFSPQTLSNSVALAGAGVATAFVLSPAVMPLAGLVFSGLSFFKGISLYKNGEVAIADSKRNKYYLAEVDYKIRENEELRTFLSENANKLDKNEVDKLIELLQKEHENMEISRDIMQLVLLDEKHGLFPFTARALIKDFNKKLKADPTLLGEYPLIQFNKMGNVILKKTDNNETKGQQLEFLNKKKQVILRILGYNSEAEYFGRNKHLFEVNNKDLISVVEQTKKLEKEIKKFKTEEYLTSENGLLKSQKEVLENQIAKYRDIEEARAEFENEDRLIENGMAY